MAKYEVLERSFINHRVHEVGEFVEHEFSDGGTHGPNLKPVDGSAKAAPKPGRGKKGAPPATGQKVAEPDSEGSDASDGAVDLT